MTKITDYEGLDSYESGFADGIAAHASAHEGQTEKQRIHDYRLTFNAALFGLLASGKLYESMESLHREAHAHATMEHGKL